MTRPRRRFSEMEVLLTVLRQGGTIPCRCCKQPVTERDILTGNVEKEHIHELALGGADDPSNCSYSHKKQPCHARQTNGNGATTAGSSANRLAKANEPGRTEKFQVNKPPLALVATVDPGEKCRGCGEFAPECTCPKREKRPAFQRAR